MSRRIRLTMALTIATGSWAATVHGGEIRERERAAREAIGAKYRLMASEYTPPIGETGYRAIGTTQKGKVIDGSADGKDIVGDPDAEKNDPTLKRYREEQERLARARGEHWANIVEWSTKAEEYGRRLRILEEQLGGCRATGWRSWTKDTLLELKYQAEAQAMDSRVHLSEVAARQRMDTKWYNRGTARWREREERMRALAATAPRPDTQSDVRAHKIRRQAGATDPRDEKWRDWSMQERLSELPDEGLNHQYEESERVHRWDTQRREQRDTGGARDTRPTGTDLGQITNEITRLERQAEQDREEIKKTEDVYLESIANQMKALDAALEEHSRKLEDEDDALELRRLQLSLEFEHDETNKINLRKEIDDLNEQIAEKEFKRGIDDQKDALSDKKEQFQKEKDLKLKSLDETSEAEIWKIESQIARIDRMVEEKLAGKNVAETLYKNLLESDENFKHVGAVWGGNIVDGMADQVRAFISGAADELFSAAGIGHYTKEANQRLGDTITNNDKSITIHLNGAANMSPAALAREEEKLFARQELRGDM
jgi:hypothetical protein